MSNANNETLVHPRATTIDTINETARWLALHNPYVQMKLRLFGSIIRNRIYADEYYVVKGC